MKLKPTTVAYVLFFFICTINAAAQTKQFPRNKPLQPSTDSAYSFSFRTDTGRLRMLSIKPKAIIISNQSNGIVYQMPTDKMPCLVPHNTNDKMNTALAPMPSMPNSIAPQTPFPPQQKKP